MYVAAGSLHRYNRPGGWDSGTWARPSGKVFDLAATKDYLYALINPERPSVWRWDGDPDHQWVQLVGYGGSPQSIYSETETDANGKPITDKVFVGTRQGDPSENGIDYSIYYVDDASVPAELLPGEKTGRLTGAAYDSNSGKHFISTYGRGVYTLDGLTVTQLWNTANSNDKNRNLMGIIRTGPGKVFAFDRGETDIYEVNVAQNTWTQIKSTSSPHSTGAVALWRLDDTATEGRILLGIRDGSNYGYVEVRLDFPT
jgi:hypothetical protein